MKLTKLMRALGRAVARQACRACIERCDLIAGSAGCAAAMAAMFDETAATDPTSVLQT